VSAGSLEGMTSLTCDMLTRDWHEYKDIKSKSTLMLMLLNCFSMVVKFCHTQF
jgi:hypothetical protein